MEKPKYSNIHNAPLPHLSNHDPDPADGVRVDESPVPGLTLKRILRGHTGKINRITWSPDGRLLASPSDDKTIRVWDVADGSCTAVLMGHTKAVLSAKFSPIEGLLSSISEDITMRLWDVKTSNLIKTTQGSDWQYFCLAFSPDGKKIIDADENEIRFSVVSSGELTHSISDFNGRMFSNSFAPLSLSYSTHNPLVACGMSSPDDDSQVVILINPDEERIESSIHIESGDGVYGVDWHPNGQMIAATSGSKVFIIDVARREVLIELEGHTDGLDSVSFSADGLLIATRSHDNTTRFWNCRNWETVAILPEQVSSGWIHSIAFHPYLPRLATLGEADTIIRIWDLDLDELLSQTMTKSIRYTTAKLVLVGDSGVGKTGLGWRLAHGEFKEHASTHGQQFWVIDELSQTRADGTECEAVLWDLAGQPDYRLVHALFLDNVDTALVMFDPTNRQEPLAGVAFWLNQLKNKGQDLCNSILVGARTDRGSSTLTEAELESYCERNNICGGYISTSALSGDGISKLIDCLKANIPWEEMKATVTTQTFKRIKEYVLNLKEQTDQKNILVKPAELRAQLQATDSGWEFSDAEMMTAVGHLATHGYVTVMRSSQGTQSILLVPDLLANLASSIVLEARRNPRGLGVLEESRLLAGEYAFSELQILDEDECEILLDATAVLFLEHNLCFRETFNQQTFLVFPSLINKKWPKDEDFNPAEGASYLVKGAVENVYASLVVLLGYTNTFIRTHQWQNQAQYEMGEGEICGFQQTSYEAGEIELILYYADHTPEPAQLIFRGLFERFLSHRELEIWRYQPVLCAKCGSQLARNVVMSQLAKNKDFSFCNECGAKLSLPSPEPLTRLSRREEAMIDAQQVVAQRRTAFEAALVRVKALLRDCGETEKSTCFISYAWGVPEHERWVLQLAKDLRNAGIDVLIDRWHSPPGSNLDLFIERILSSDFVLPVGTPELRQKYDTQKADPIVAAELKLINLRVRQSTAYGDTVLPVLLAGEAQTSLSPQLRPLVCVDFREEKFYFSKLFDMIWRIYNLPFDNPLLEELQALMSPQRKWK